MPEEQPRDIAPLIFGFETGPDEAPQAIDWPAVSEGQAGLPGVKRWLHLNRLSGQARSWLTGPAGIEPLIAEALFQEDTRPRVTCIGDGLLVNLRGVNLNEDPGDNPMISIRLWVSEELIVSTRAFRIMAAEDLAEKYRSAAAPARHGETLVYLIERLTIRLEPFIRSFEEEVDRLEEELLDTGVALSSAALAAFRRSVLSVRRYIIPQREAISTLILEETGLLSDRDRVRLRQAQDDITRLAEDLDVIRERAQVLQDQVIEQRSEAMNQRLFLLAIVSAVFLPLGFITGLFGVNVGGMPGVDSALGFTLLCAGVAASAGGIWVLFKRMKWI